MEYLAFISQNNPLFSSFQLPSTPTTSTPTLPTPSQGRSFSRPNRGTGGALAEKQKVSKEITASATKRKSLIEVPADGQALPVSEITEALPTRQAKRPKVTKVVHLLVSLTTTNGISI